MVGVGEMQTPADGEWVKDLADIRKLVLFYYSSMFCGCLLRECLVYKL